MSVNATQRSPAKRQTQQTFYGIEVTNPITHGVGKVRYNDYEIRMKTNLPVLKLKDASARRRYRDFQWLRIELERGSKIVVPSLPRKALKRQLPFSSDDGIFEEEFIDTRKKALQQFVNKVAGHSLAQNEKCLHVMFLQDVVIDKNYMPSKIRSA